MVRFGLTFGVDRNAPEAHEVGPAVALGARLGRFGGEINYAYLSVFDMDTSIHRVGVALRADLYRRHARPCVVRRCIHTSAIYGELGAAERFGTWRTGEMLDRYESGRRPELQVALGYEIRDSFAIQRAAWQIGLRFSVARRDPFLSPICRGVSCKVAMPASSGLAESVMLEWMFLLGG
jgi:hypothetical protein